MKRVTASCPYCEESFRPRSSSPIRKITCPHCGESFAPAEDNKQSSHLLLFAALGGALALIGVVVLILLVRRGEQPGEPASAPLAKVSPTPVTEKVEPSAPKDASSPAPKTEVAAPPMEITSPPPPEAEPVPKPPAVVVPPKPKPGGITPERIALALDRGVAFLKTRQLPGGGWPRKDHEVGYTALAGLALLECGVPIDDPSVVGAATFVRSRLAALEFTYDLSLAILFLDRLEQPGDRQLIQALALRLAAGQTDKGGWDYKCPILSPPQMGSLLTFLQSNRPKTAFQVAVRDDLGKFVGQAKHPVQSSSSADTSTQAAQRPAVARDPYGNDQGAHASTGSLAHLAHSAKQPDFGQGRAAEPDVWRLTTLKKQEWMAERGTSKEAFSPPRFPMVRAKPRKDVPGERKSVAVVRPPVHLLPAALRDLPVVGGSGKMRKGRDDNSNTQFALLALWAARRHDLGGERALQFSGFRFRATQNPDGGWGYQPGKESTPPMTCVGMLGLAMSLATIPELPKAAPRDAAGRIILEDPQLQRGLARIAASIGHPVEDPTGVRMQSAYYLWSVERMAMLYGLAKIGGKDWYGWGAQILLTNQGLDGSWNGGGYHGSDAILDTCFAVLFLRRSNLAHEFTDALQRHVAFPHP